MLTQPDFEKYAQTLQETMAAAIAEGEALNKLAAADREAAADVRITIQEKLNALETLGRQAAEKQVHEHRQQLKETIWEDVLNSVAAKLLHNGESADDIAKILDISERL